MATSGSQQDQVNAEERRKRGEFVRPPSTARNFINATNTETGEVTYPAEAARYHLYVAYNCPWCHRVVIGRSVLGLESAITMDVAFPNRTDDSHPLGPNWWRFAPDGIDHSSGRHISFPECTSDTVFGKETVKQCYEACGVDDQKSVPLLICKKTGTVVSNESSEILRMMATEMRHLGTNPSMDLYPEDKAAEIDEINAMVYQEINNGSYRAGFSSNQDVYESSYHTYFAALGKCEALLGERKFLLGDKVTEADLRLFCTVFRHDPVYHSRFKLDDKYITDYPHLTRWMRSMYADVPGVAEQSGAGYLAHCKQGYFGRSGNGTVPLGPPGYPGVWMQPNAR